VLWGGGLLVRRYRCRQSKKRQGEEPYFMPLSS
jgi:hypothetical protein